MAQIMARSVYRVETESIYFFGLESESNYPLIESVLNPEGKGIGL